MLLIKVLCCICLITCLCSSESISSRKNKYDLEFTSVSKCKVPVNKMDNSNSLLSNISLRKVRNFSLIDIEMNVTRDFGPVLITCRTYEILENSPKKLIYKLDKVPCTNPIIRQLLAFLKLRLDKQCYSYPGYHIIRNVNLSNFSFLLTKTASSSGKYVYEVEFSYSKGIVACYSVTCQLIENKG